MIRKLDILYSIIGLVSLFPLLCVLYMLGWIFNRSPIFRQERVGQGQKQFVLVKFRTMRLDTNNMPTHLVDASAVTTYGRLLRKTKLDELPQLWNVLIGEMSIVGPRPCLVGQQELIEERVAQGVFDARPGITGLAQIQRIGMDRPALLASIDAEMLVSLDVLTYHRYIILTLLGRGFEDMVRE